MIMDVVFRVSGCPGKWRGVRIWGPVIGGITSWEEAIEHPGKNYQEKGQDQDAVS